MITKGIKFSKKANMWCAYYNFNEKKKTNETYWFSSKELAEEKLKELSTR